MKFIKYMHVENIKGSATAGLLKGEYWVFPKLDGSNGVVWTDGDKVKAGSRNRELSLGDDNHGFCAYVVSHTGIKAYLEENPHHILYGEWLVPHSIKNYNPEALRQFYVFDVYDCLENRFIPYEIYRPNLSMYYIHFVPAIVEEVQRLSLTESDLIGFMEVANGYLLPEGAFAEGIVFKNYSFVNKHNETVWAKYINPHFENGCKRKKRTLNLPGEVEGAILDNYCTDHFINKEVAKLLNDKCVEWSVRLIPECLGKIWYEFVTENMWEVLKKMKNPTVNFKALQQSFNRRVVDVLMTL